MRFRPNDDPNWIGKTSIWGWILIRRFWRSGRDTTGQPQEIVVFLEWRWWEQWRKKPINNHLYIILSYSFSRFFFLNWKPLKWLMSPKKTKAAPYNLWWNIWRTSPFLGFSNSRWRQLCCHGRHLLCLDLRFGKCFFWQEGRDEETSFDANVHGECYEQKESHRWHGWQLNKPFCSDWSSLEFIFEVVEPGSFN